MAADRWARWLWGGGEAELDAGVVEELRSTADSVHELSDVASLTKAIRGCWVKSGRGKSGPAGVRSQRYLKAYVEWRGKVPALIPNSPLMCAEQLALSVPDSGKRMDPALVRKCFRLVKGSGALCTAPSSKLAGTWRTAFFT